MIQTAASNPKVGGISQHQVHVKVSTADTQSFSIQTPCLMRCFGTSMFCLPAMVHWAAQILASDLPSHVIRCWTLALHLKRLELDAWRQLVGTGFGNPEP